MVPLNLTEGYSLETKSKMLISKSAKYQNLRKFMSEIFKVKIGWSPELMNDLFKFIEDPYSQRKDWQFKPESPNAKI